MNTTAPSALTRVSDTLLRQKRKLLIGAGVLVSYAVLGFLVAPWLIKKNAMEYVDSNLNASLAIDKVSLNPFVLSLAINGMALDGSDGEPVATVKRIFVNFQLSSLFRRAWTFREFYINTPEFFLARDEAGVLNIATINSRAGGSSAEAEQAADDASPRLLIFDFAITESSVAWNDYYVTDSVETVFGPINIQIADLNTLPQREGRQDVVITTDTQGTLSWSGSLQLNPFNSSGQASIKGSHFPLTSAYIRHDTGLDIVEGLADVALQYNVATGADGAIRASVDEFELTFSDLLVRTFSGSLDDDQAERDLLALPRLALTGGDLRWPERTVSVSALEIDDAHFSLYRGENGQLALPGSGDDADTVSSEAATIASEDDAWTVDLARLAVNRLSFDLEDDSLQPPAITGIESLDLEIRDINNSSGSRFPTQMSLVPRAGGVVRLAGELGVIPSLEFGFDMSIESVPLSGAQPYVQAAADVNLASGEFDLTGEIRSNEAEPLHLSGDFVIRDLLVEETDEGSRLGSWSELTATQFVFSVAEQAVEIASIEMQAPYGDVLIAADGTLNLGRVAKAPATAGEEPESAEATDEQPSSFEIVVGTVDVINGEADFADLSLPLPFSAEISQLNGEISTIDTNSSEPASVSFEGTVDEFGLVQVSGHITPVDASQNTDMQVTFENVEVPKFSAYTIPFAGREIASGRMDLALGYEVQEGELVGENKLVLRDLELGDEVEHPGAMSLPLGLAVALLKDGEGKIDIDLPVRGNVNDPEFQYGGVVMQALGRLIVNIVASPFALLGNLLGVEANELEYIDFQAGRADLTPPEQEKTAQLAEALGLRPGLVLEFNGAIDREADGLEMRRASLETLIEERLAVIAADENESLMFAEQEQIVLELLFAEANVSEDPVVALDALRTQFTAAPETEAVEPTFDRLAYTGEIRRQLVAAQTLVESDFVTLATGRANNVRASIESVDPALSARIVAGQLQAIAADDDGRISMKMVLTAGGAD